MNSPRFFPLTLIALAVVAGCSTTPAPNARLDEARSNYRMALDDPQTRDMAGSEMRQASDALNKATDAWTRKESPAEVDHLAYLTKQKVLIAQEAARQKTAELAVTQADAARDKLRLEARTNEADTAQRSAAASQQQSEASQRQAASAQRQAEAAKQQANDAQARSSQLEVQLRDLNAKKTDRGLVVTLGDVLFDTNQAQLKSGGMRSVQKLSTFLTQYPERRALVEGFTDNTGSEGLNQDLSGRRAAAVRAALVSLGVSGDRIATHGYGEAYPVAGNDSAGGRQMNRRVEIVLSADDGSIAPR